MRYGYARVSSEDQDLSLQRSALRDAGVEQLVEEKRSGAADDRPRLLQLLATIGAGDELVVWKLDRLGRNFRHLYDTVTDLEKRNVKFVSLRDSIDTSTAMGRLFFIMLAAFAEFEREIIRERTIAGIAEAKAQGVVLGHRMFGFLAGTNRPNEVEAALVKELANRVIDGDPLRGIARDLNDAGVPTNRGKRWEATTIRRTLGNDRIATILGYDTHTEVLRRLHVRSERAGRPGSHLLSGFVICECGTPMYASRRNDGVWLYKCKRGQSKYPETCGRLSIVAEPLEQHVVTKLFERWETYEQVTEDDTHEAAMLVADLEAKLADLAERVRGGLSIEFALPLEQGWREDLARARRQRDAAVRVVGYRPMPTDTDVWDHATMAEKRELLRNMGLRVQVRAVERNGNHNFNPKRVEVHFSGRP
jgi:DNA invertase Pin-like site-specific DNA recombinase